MKNIKNNIIWLFAMIIVISSCETTELDLLNDPNSAPPGSIDVNFALNSIELNFSEFFESVTSAGADAVRLEYMFDTYEANFNNTNNDLSGAWTTAYADILKDVEAVIRLSDEGNDFFIQAGIARIIRAYTLLTLVDYFGPVPLSEALQGDTGVTFPGTDAPEDVYAAALQDLNDAITDFGKTTLNPPTTDLLYNTDTAKWTKLVNTLKLKYYLNLRLVNQTLAATEIQNLITEDNFISSANDNFLWRAVSSNLPQSRHQYYIDEYLAASTGDYISNYLMWSLTIEKGIDDPRLRYYVYRQVDGFPSDPATLDNEISCWNDPRPSTFGPIDMISAQPLPFCSLFGRGDGYWGRDHSDNQGIPPDNALRATYGVYPAGGRFDDDDAEDIDPGDGLDGAGIWPIMTDSFVYFMRAEAALFLGTTDDARTMLENGIRASIANVTGFLPNPGDFTNIPTTADIDDYATVALTLYDAAASDAERMNVIGKEYWISLFGNGVEAYNLYRRTGAPNNLQPTLLGTGNFPRSFLYPNVVVDRNPNIQQKSDLTVQTFWDNNPAGFIQ